MLRSRRLRSQKRPRQTLTCCSEAHHKHRTRLRDSELPTNDRSARNARGTHSSRQHAKEGGGYSVQNRPQARPAAAAAIITQARSASQRPRPPIQAKPKIILKFIIDVGEEHGTCSLSLLAPPVLQEVQVLEHLLRLGLQSPTEPAPDATAHGLRPLLHRSSF